MVDDHDRPIAGVKVGMITGGSHVSSELRHQSTTNAEGQYRLREIPRRAIDGRPLELQILLAKEGYASFVSPSRTLKENATEKLEVVEPIRLERGGSMSGIVVDHRGQPVAGARVLTSLDVRYRGLDDHMARVRTDEKGRFTIRDLPRGSPRLIASDGKTSSSTIHLRLGNSNPVVCLQLPESRPRRDLPLKDRVVPGGPEPLRNGQAALEWQGGYWSDGPICTSSPTIRAKPSCCTSGVADSRQSAAPLPPLAKPPAAVSSRGVSCSCFYSSPG